MANLIRGASLLNFSELVTMLGGEPEPLLRAQGIDPAVTTDTDKFIRYTAHAAAVGAAARALNCPDFGMRLARVQGIEILGPVSVLIRNSETVADAVEGGTRFLYYCSPAEVTQLVRGRWSSALTLEVALRPFPDREHAIEKGLGISMDMFRLLLGDDFIPERVTMMHGQMSASEVYEEMFKCDVEFGSEKNSIHVSNQQLAKPVVGRDAAALSLAQDYLSQIRPDLAVADNIRDLTHRLLTVGDASLNAVAQAMSLHPRVVQRRLAECGTNFEDILDDLRRTMAWQLAATGMQASQISTMLGYAEQSSFSRACRRWYDESPRQLLARRRLTGTGV